MMMMVPEAYKKHPTLMVKYPEVISTYESNTVILRSCHLALVAMHIGFCLGFTTSVLAKCCLVRSFVIPICERTWHAPDCGLL